MSKTSSNKLKATLENFKLFYDQSPDMYVSVSPEDASILYCNQTLLEKLKYKKSEVLGAPVFKLYHPDSYEQAQKTFNQFVNNGFVKNTELVLKTKTGEKLDVSLNTKAVRDENDQILFSISSWRDISDIVQTKKVLEIKQKELNCIRELNALQSKRHQTEDDFLQQSTEIIKRTWLTKESSSIEILYNSIKYKKGVSKSKSEIISEDLIIQGNKTGTISIHTKKQSEELLKQHKRFLKDISNIIVETLTNKQNDNLMMIMNAAIKSTTDCVAIASSDGTHIYQNDALKKMLGYSFEEIKENRPHSIYKDKKLAHELFSTIMSGKSWKGEADIIHKNGHIVQVFIRADAIKNKSGDIIGLFGIHTDITEKKDLEKTQKQRQQQALKIFDAINDVVYVADPNSYELLFTNKSLNDRIGKGKDLTGKKCYQALQGLNSPCDFCTNPQLFDKNNNGSIVWDFQNLLDKHWYRCTDKKIEWFDGREVRMEIASDITEVKKANIRLAESEERYQLATSASNNGIWDWWVKENQVFYSDKWKAQIGYAPDELDDTFENWQINLHPDDHDRMVNAVQEFLANPKDYFIEEFRFKHKDGTYRWINNKAAAVLNEKGEVIRMFGSHSDVTDIKLAEDALKKTDQLYRNLIQNAPDGIVVVDYQGNFKFASPSSLSMFDYTNEELLMHHANELTHPEDLEIVLETLEKLILNGDSETPTIEYRFLHKSKGWLWIESTFSKTHDEEENPAIVINFRNITDRKHYEEELIEAKKKAEIANVHKNHFLANMSHEIRTPMNGVVGFADLLKQEDIDEVSKKKFLQIIDKNAKQLLTLIDDIIDIAKIEAQELKILKSKFYLNEILHELHDVFERIRISKAKESVSINLNLPDNTKYIQVYTDASRLRQILSNLIGNALKFTETGKINFGYTIKNEYLHFYVEDTGRGIPKDHLNDIFERFQQVSLEDSTEHGGTGLGLSISKGLVQILGGDIKVQSEENKGSRFDFKIPIGIKSNGNHSPETSNEKIEEKSLNGKTILLAEDDESIQFYYQTVFELYDVTLIIAENGRKAVNIYKNNPDIDLVLMDIRMPELNGLKATNQILAFNPNATIIAQTAYVMPEEREKCLEVGCKDYLMKPIKKKELIAKIIEHI